MFKEDSEPIAGLADHASAYQAVQDGKSRLPRLTKRVAIWQSIQQKAHTLYSVIGTIRVFDQDAVSDEVRECKGRQ
jgi:hypothetical protein